MVVDIRQVQQHYLLNSAEGLCMLLFTFTSTIRRASLALSYKTGHNLLKDMVAKNPGKTPNPPLFPLSYKALWRAANHSGPSLQIL